MKSDLFTVAAVIGAITARQEQIEWWLRNGAAAFAIVASIVAIWTKLRANRTRHREDHPLD